MSTSVMTVKRWAVYKRQADGSPGDMLGVQHADSKDSATKAAIKAYGIPWRSLVVRLDRTDDASEVVIDLPAEAVREVPSADLDEAQRLDAEVDRCLDEANEKASAFYDAMLEVHRSEAWRPLGFGSWAAYAESKLGKARRTVYERLEAAAVVKELEVVRNSAQGGERREQVSPRDMPVSQLHALAKAPEGTRSEVLEVAVEAAGGKPTAETVRAAVEAKKAAPEAPKEELVKAVVEAVEKPRTPPRTFVNGEAKEDPSVERLRAAGKIPFDAVVEIEDPGEDVVDVEAIRDEREEHAAKVEADQTDDEWLATLPLYSRLDGIPRDIFRRDALLFRRMTPHRRSYAARARVELKEARRGTARSNDGKYAFRLRSHLSFPDPSRWLICPPTEHGGCGGTGQVELIGECRKCYGSGYIVPNS